MEQNTTLPQVVYSLAANGGSPFIRWAVTSMLMIKYMDPLFKTVLCTDESTLKVLDKTSHSLLKVADEIKVIEDFNGTVRERSRWVKINLRNMVEGDFLYFDCDAIPVGDISALYNHQSDLAVIDTFSFIKGIDEWYIPSCKSLKWGYSSDKHYSGGLFFLRDNERSRSFYELWKKKWLVWREFDRSGVSADQPAFNSAIVESDLKLLTLPLKYNIPLTHPNSNTEDPRIFHYPASVRRMSYSSLLSKLSRDYAATGELNYKRIEKAVKSQNPWVLPMPLVWLEYFSNGITHVIVRNIRKRLPVHLRKRMVR